jgi:hypothetical protein
LSAAPEFLTLIAKARRRAVWNLLGEQASVGTAAALAGAVLLLLLGTGILEWYWPVVLFFGGTAVAAWRTRRSLPSAYEVAQRVDQRLELADVLSTAFHFISHPGANHSPAFVDAQRRTAERAAASTTLSEAMPWTLPKQLYVAGALLAAGSGLFLVRFGMLGTLDLRQPMVEAVADFFHPEGEITARNKGGRGPKDDPLAIPLDRPDMIKQPDIDKAPEDVLNTVDVPEVNVPFEDKDNLASRQSEAKAQSDESGDEMAEGDERGEKSEGGKEGKEGADGQGESPDGKEKGPQNAKQGSGNEPNSSMLDKMRDAMANLLNKMKLPNQQQRASNQKGQEKGQPGEQQGQGQKGEKGQGQQQGKGTPTEDQDAEGQGEQQAQSGQGKSNDKTAEAGTPTDAKSGMGKQDGSKDLKDAEQLAAMGKLTEIFGKRAQNMAGEVMVEVQNGKSQSLRTQYTQREASHRESGGEIHRDEVPLQYQHYIQQYFEQVRKGEKPVSTTPPSTAPGKPR